MWYKLSKVSLAIAAIGLGFGVCQSANAHYRKSIVPVTVPQHDTGFHFGITGFYVRPTNHELYYSIEGLTDQTDFFVPFSRVFHAVVPDHSFNWRLDGGIFLGDSGNDFSANWTHVSSSDDDRVDAQTDVPLFNRFIVGEWDFVKGDAEFDFDEVNIEVGQLVNYCNLSTRFFFGFSGVWINEEFRTRSEREYNGEVEILHGNLEVTHAKVDSEFWGFGPRLGVDIIYSLGGPGSYFSLVGHASGALLGGKLQAREKDLRVVDSTVPMPVGAVMRVPHSHENLENTLTLYDRTIDPDNQFTVVPAGTVRLGLRFALNPDPAGNGFAAEVGYQVTGYYHVLQMAPDFTGQQELVVDMEAITFQTEPVLTNPVSNFGFNGFYLTLSYS